MENIRLNDTEREETVNAYLERRAIEQRKEEGKNKIIKGVMIAGGAAITIVAVVGSAGTATPVVASVWGQVVVVGSAGMSAAYGISETVEGVDLYRLALEGDTLTIARNPIRDVVFGGNEELYQLWGETNVQLMQLGMGGSAAYKLIKSEGILAFGAEVGKIAGSELAGELTTQYMIEELGMSETDAWLIGMVTSDATYGSLNWMQGSIWGGQRIENTKRNKKTSFENEIPRTGEEWNEFFIEKYGPENVVWGTKSGSDTIKNIQSKTPQQLIAEGWEDITNPKMAANTSSREYYDPTSGLKIRFDKGVEGANGFEAVDHYHVMNPNYTNKKVDYYLDINGVPVGKGSKASHIVIKGGNN